MCQSLCWSLYVLTILAHEKSVTVLGGDSVSHRTEETEAQRNGVT